MCLVRDQCDGKSQDGMLTYGEWHRYAEEDDAMFALCAAMRPAGCYFTPAPGALPFDLEEEKLE